MPRKFVLSCDLLQREFSALPIRIGRNALNDFKLPVQIVSAFHARIDELDGVIGVVDLNSKNGTFVRSPDGGLAQVPPGELVNLAHSGNEFILGPDLAVRVEVISGTAPVANRPFSGNVLGNPEMLENGAKRAVRSPSAPGSLPGLDPIRPMPAIDMSRPGNQRASSPPPRGTSPAPAPQNPPAALRGTAGLNVDLGELALTGLRELVSSLVPGKNLETTGDVARLVTKLHDAVEVFCRCFIPLREGHSQFVSNLDLQREASLRRQHRSAGYAKVEAARTPEEVAAALLDFRDRSEDSPTAIEGIFADLMVHQVALLDGMMQGVRALLDELSPERIEEAVDHGSNALSLKLSRHKALWQEYLARYDELSNERQTVQRIFGSEFAVAYQQYGKKRDGG